MSFPYAKDAFPIKEVAIRCGHSMRGSTLLGGAAVYSFANVANSAIPFLLLPLLTRVLSPEEYGSIAVFAVLISVFNAFTGLSVHGAIGVRYFDPGIDRGRYIASALAILSASTLATILVVLLSGRWISEQTEIAQWWVLMAAFASAANFITQVRLVVWQLEGSAARYGIFQVMQTALNVVLSIVLVLDTKLGWEGRAAGILAAALVGAAFAFLSLRRTVLTDLRVDASYARDALRFGVPLMPHVLGSILIASSDRLLLANLMNMHEVGVYAAGMQIGLVIGVIADAAAKAVGPWLYANLAKSSLAMKRKIVRFTYLYFIGIGITGITFGLAAPYLLVLLGEQYRSNQQVILYIAVGGAFSGMYLMVVSYIFLVKRNELLSAASISVGVFNLAASYFLVQRFGAVGAAQAYAASQLLMFLATWIVAARCYPMPWRAALGRFPKDATVT